MADNIEHSNGIIHWDAVLWESHKIGNWNLYLPLWIYYNTPSCGKVERMNCVGIHLNVVFEFNIFTKF